MEYAVPRARKFEALWWPQTNLHADCFRNSPCRDWMVANEGPCKGGGHKQG